MHQQVAERRADRDLHQFAQRRADRVAGPPAERRGDERDPPSHDGRSVAFGLGHSYQGAGGAVKTGLVGLAFGVLYVATGSIWVPIVAHIVLDVLQGAAIHEILRKDNDQLEPQPA